MKITRHGYKGQKLIARELLPCPECNSLDKMATPDYSEFECRNCGCKWVVLSRKKEAIQ